MKTSDALEARCTQAKPSGRALVSFGRLLAELCRLLRHQHWLLLLHATVTALLTGIVRQLLGAAEVFELPSQPTRRADRAFIMPPNQWAVP